MSANSGMQIDPYSPAEMAQRAEIVGVNKARLDFLSTLTLGVLAGAFIALGAQLATVVSIDSTLGYGPTRLLVGIAFSLGLILVVIAGAELFTGNTLMVLGWLSHKVTSRQLLRNWSIVLLGNVAGALATVGLVFYAGQWAFAGYNVGASAVSIANAKVELSFTEALMRGILCNAMVNLAVWLCLSARSNVDRIFSIVPPIAGFVASGFEHSIANLYFVPMGILLRNKPDVLVAGGLNSEAVADLTWRNFLIDNLLPVTLGNVIGGGLLVAAVYWLVYLRPKSQPASAADQPSRRLDTSESPAE